MIDLAISLPVLCATAFAFGCRHALDADHLTVIDGIARRNALVRPGVAFSGGILFSFGHAAVVMIVAVAVMRLAGDAAVPPAWLGAAGLATSGTLLILLGVLNLRAAWSTPADRHAALIGWRAGLTRKGDHPLAVVATGALFAISFDTIALAFGIGLASKGISGAASVAPAAACFGGGMALVAGANGAWIVHLLRSATTHARTISRIMTAAIGALNLMLGLLAFAALRWTSIDDWRDNNGLLISGIVIASCAAAFLAALHLKTDRSHGNQTAPGFVIGNR